MKERIKLGLVCLARETFDHKAAAAIYEGLVRELSRLENVDWEALPGLVISVEDARRAAARLAAAGLDGMVCLSGTFHLGHLVLELRSELRLPFLLWGLPELPYDGGKIRLNSVCGVNLDASNLYKSGVDDYTASVGPGIDETWVDAIRAIAALRRARVGVAGDRAHGFFNLGVSDTELFGEVGALVDHFELSELYAEPAAPSALELRREQLRGTFDCSGVTEAQVAKVAELAARIDAFCGRTGLTALAIRCWPEFARDYGVAPCAAMSLLQSEGRLLACEGDLEGALSMIAHRAVGGETPFLFDFSQVDLEKNYALLWHCGVAPCNLWDGVSKRSLDTYFAGGRGVTAGFVLKAGPVSIARLDSARGKRRLLLQEGRALPMEKELSGTYAKVEFGRPVKELLDLIVYKGFAHHASAVYGSYSAPLRLAARLKGWEVAE
ncbi:MAG TPA: fucose isomerase [Spirochaetales bacterium]|nr:fucose isomerase [Spirochaetales bacterium]HRY53084.1 fucose isomerase [Spirochaetia bacterium]HRZ64921.1 fucose isomerase [Spirochaetia bacterium]